MISFVKTGLSEIILERYGRAFWPIKNWPVIFWPIKLNFKFQDLEYLFIGGMYIRQ